MSWEKLDESIPARVVFIKFQKQPFSDAPEVGVLKNFAIFTEKHLCWSLFLIKLYA